MQCAKFLLFAGLMMFINCSFSMSFDHAKYIYDTLIKLNQIPNPPKLGVSINTSINAESGKDKKGHDVIIITLGLLATNNDDEMAWVLGHEIGHFLDHDYNKNHGWKLEYDADLWGGLLAHNAGYDVCTGVQQFFTSVPPDDGVGSDHPPSKQRQKIMTDLYCK